ncbi:hypothetical protein LP422_24295 [Janibacter limosus]|uniref:hypothetical protein n=1 Tax=Janibacter limosus TaxID=53458 RepID=UPI0035DE4C26|nr:hypothetical protein LP422_24295 [Janibacter limosus]
MGTGGVGEDPEGFAGRDGGEHEQGHDGGARAGACREGGRCEGAGPGDHEHRCGRERSAAGLSGDRGLEGVVRGAQPPGGGGRAPDGAQLVGVVGTELGDTGDLGAGCEHLGL